jgi:hypothetical protein
VSGSYLWEMSFIIIRAHRPLVDNPHHEPE